MNIVLQGLNAAFAAFVVWLTVRIINRGERWAKWTAVALIVVSAMLAIFWLSRPPEGIIFDPIEIPSNSINGQ